MTSELQLTPSRGRLFKLFTDLGPYFRKLQSTENSFFFDCLDICVNDKKEPEEREFYGWWLIVTRDENGFDYERFDGIYNLDGDWVVTKISKKDQQTLDTSFELFIERLKALIDVETGFCLVPLETSLTEA